MNRIKTGLRFVVELKKEANPQVILNQLYKFTDMQATCSVIMLALVHNEPKILNLKQVLEQYISHQKEVICGGQPMRSNGPRRGPIFWKG